MYCKDVGLICNGNWVGFRVEFGPKSWLKMSIFNNLVRFGVRKKGKNYLITLFYFILFPFKIF